MNPVDYDSLNTSELRVICERAFGGNRFISPWTSRGRLLGYLEERDEFPFSPMDTVRVHQINEIVDKIDSFKSQIPAKIPSGETCKGNCFEHCDMRVVECQVSNPTLRHTTY